MPSSHGHAGAGAGGYDQSLLASAPEATKQMRQEGYNADIINTPKRANNTSSNNLHRDLESGVASKEHLAGHTATSTTPIPSKRVPFYRTTKGKVILGIAALVVIGAIIGGAVGGTRGKKKGGDDLAPVNGGAAQPGNGDDAGAGVASSSSQPANPFSALSGALSSGTGTATAGQPVQSNPAGPPVSGGGGQQVGGGGQQTGGQGQGQRSQSVGQQRAALNGELSRVGNAIGSELVPRL